MATAIIKTLPNMVTVDSLAMAAAIPSKIIMDTNQMLMLYIALRILSRRDESHFNS